MVLLGVFMALAFGSFCFIFSPMVLLGVFMALAFGSFCFIFVRFVPVATSGLEAA